MAISLTALQEELLQEFFRSEDIPATAQAHFRTYLVELLSHNEQFNITAITGIKEALQDHFKDSLSIRSYIKQHGITSIADVGAGGGFPSIPLKLYFPHLSVILIEVNNKKAHFLNNMIDALQLSNTTVYTQDWRTFLRKTDFSIDLFCARASLSIEELTRLFKPGCVYNEATLAYWASRLWQPTEKQQPMIVEQMTYQIESKERRLVFFKKPNEKGACSE